MVFERQGNTKPYLYVSNELKSARAVTYCYNVQTSFKENLIRRLLGQSDFALGNPRAQTRNLLQARIFSTQWATQKIMCERSEAPN